MAEKMDGKGFESGPLTGKELSEHREMYHDFQEMRSILKSFVNLVRSSKVLAAIFAVASAIGGGVAWIMVGFGG